MKVSPSELEQIAELARRHGFETPDEYIWSLLDEALWDEKFVRSRDVFDMLIQEAREEMKNRNH